MGDKLFATGETDKTLPTFHGFSQPMNDFGVAGGADHRVLPFQYKVKMFPDGNKISVGHHRSATLPTDICNATEL
nr:hypothetical protein [Geotalea uraniireducens]